MTTLIVVMLIVVLWLLAMTVVWRLCRAAARGDEADARRRAEATAADDDPGSRVA